MLIEISKTQPDGSRVFAFRTVNFADAPRNPELPVLHFMPSGIYVNIAGRNTIVTWTAVIYLPPEQQATGDFDPASIFLNTAISITAFSATLQSTMSGSKQVVVWHFLPSSSPLKGGG